MKFNEKIYALRRKKGWSQEELANELDVSRQSVYKWESGENVPDVDKIKKLAKIFNVSLDILLDDECDLHTPTDSTPVAKKDSSDCEDGLVATTNAELDEIDEDGKFVAEEHGAPSSSEPATSNGGGRVVNHLSALLIEIVKLVINCITIPLYFIRFFHEVAVLPGISENGESTTHRIDYYYSIYDKIAREGLATLVWVGVVITVWSILFCVLNMVIKDNKVLKIAGYTVWGVSMGLFLALLLASCLIWYAY